MSNVPWTNSGRNKFWLVGCLGSEPRLAQSQTWRYANFIRRLGEAVFRICIIDFALQLMENHEKASSGYSKSVRHTGAESDSFVRSGHRGLLPRLLCWSMPPLVLCQATGTSLCHRKYLPCGCTRWFPTSVNVGSKLAFWALMWSPNYGIPRSSCICLLLTYQGAPVARRKHLDCSTCTLRT